MNLLDWFQMKVLGRSDIYFGGSLYMRRWRIGPRWAPGIRLHHILRSDLDRELHDHPFSYVSFILSGGYWEMRKGHGRKWFGPGSIVVRKTSDAHRLELPRPAWTLVLRGPINNEWGFYTPDGWVPWRQFTKQREQQAANGTPGAFAAKSSLGMKEGGGT